MQHSNGVYGQQGDLGDSEGSLGDSEGSSGDWAVLPFRPRPTFDLEVDGNILFQVNQI